MGASEQIHDNRYRCVPHLARLGMLAQHLAGASAEPWMVHETTGAANAIMAEVNAGCRAALAQAAGGSRAASSRSLLRSRLARLQAAADDTVAAASRGDAATLRRQVRRFESLTAAIWAVLPSAAARSGSPATARRHAETSVANPPAGVVTALRIR